MKLKDANRIICRNLGKNRSRTFMTVFAAAIGCSFLIVLASFGYGVQKGVVDSIQEERLLNQVMIHLRRTVVEGEERYLQPTADDIAELEEMEGVKAVTRAVWVAQTAGIRVGSQEIRSNIMAVNFPAEAASGRELSAGRIPESPGEVMVGYHFAGYLAEWEKGEGEEAAAPEPHGLLGREMVIEIERHIEDEEATKAFTVNIVGIGKAPSREWERDQLIYISEELLGQMEQFTGTREAYLLEPGTPEEVREQLVSDPAAPRSYHQVNLYTHRVEQVKEIGEQLQEKGFMFYSVLHEIDQVNFYFNLFKAGLILVGTIAVIIASIGIYNTMTMAVTERSQEIGIMKAVGAHPRTVKKLFLLESAYIGIAGALGGVAIAYAVSWGINLGLPVVFQVAFEEAVPEWFRFSYIPATLTAISFIICTGVAALSGLRPAAKATRVDVLRALRREL